MVDVFYNFKFLFVYRWFLELRIGFGFIYVFEGE